MTKRNSLTAQQLLALLGGGPSRIADSVATVSPDRLRVRPTPDEWSANEVLAHLRACADVWGRCIDTILAEDDPTIRAVNPRTWIERTDYEEQDFLKSLRAFTAQRADLMTVLSALSPEEWTRSATVTGAGKPLVRTVYDYADWLATHEQPHLKQIRRTVEAVAADQGGAKAKLPRKTR